MPTLRRLEVFAEAAIDCNFRKTADRLGITQAGLSNHIHALEQELGYALFQRRRGSTPQLAPAGASLLNQVRATLETTRAFIPKPAARNEKVGPLHLNVCARNYLISRLIPMLPEFFDANPGIDLEFHGVDQAGEIIARIADGRSQIGLFRGILPAVNPPLHVQSFGQSKSRIFAAPEIAQLVSRDGVALSDIPFVLPKDGSDLSIAVEWALARIQIRPTRVVARSQFPETLADWVLSGRGAGLLFASQMQAHVAAGRVVPLGPAVSEWDIVLVSAVDGRDPRIRSVFQFFRGILGDAGF